MKKQVLHVDQLPASIVKGRVEWELRDHECNIQMRHKKTGWIIAGQWIEWEEEEADWIEKDMTEEEARNIMQEVDLRMPDGTKAIDWIGKE